MCKCVVCLVCVLGWRDGGWRVTSFFSIIWLVCYKHTFHVHVLLCIIHYTCIRTYMYSAYYMDPEHLRMHALPVGSTHDHTYAASFQVKRQTGSISLIVSLSCVFLLLVCYFFHAIHIHMYILMAHCDSQQRWRASCHLQLEDVSRLPP